MARLVYLDQRGTAREFVLDPEQSQLVIGRHPDCDLVAEDASVSRRHCIVSWEDGRFRITDLGAVNRTLVNELPIARHDLVAGDLVRCGGMALQFLEGDEPADPSVLASEWPVAVSTRFASVAGADDPSKLERLVERLKGAEARADAAEAELRRVAEQGEIYAQSASEDERALLSERLELALAERGDLDAELVALELRFGDTEATLSQREREVQIAQAWLKAAGHRLKLAEAQPTDLADAQAEIRRLQAQLEQGGSQHAAVDADLQSVDAQRDSMAESLREACQKLKQARTECAQYETRAIEAESALAGLKRSMRPQPEVDPKTAERLSAMSARLGAVTRRAKLQAAQAEQIQQLTDRIKELETSLKESGEELSAAQDATLSLMADKRTLEATLAELSTADEASAASEGSDASPSAE